MEEKLKLMAKYKLIVKYMVSEFITSVPLLGSAKFEIPFHHMPA